MSRKILHQEAYTTYIGGDDEVLGEFLQITDHRFRLSGKDEQGKGYVLDWDEMTGFSINLINAKIEDVEAGPEKLQPLVETYIILIS